MVSVTTYKDNLYILYFNNIVVYNVVLISAVPQCEPAVLFHISLFFHYSLSLILTIPPCAIQLDLTVNPHILTISLSRLIICRQLCTDVLQLLHTLMIPWSTPKSWKQPKASSSCVSSQNDVIYLSSQNTNSGIILNRPRTSNSTFTELPNNTTLILWHASQALPPPTSDEIIWSPDIADLSDPILCFIFGCFPTLLMSHSSVSFPKAPSHVFIFTLPSDTLFLKSDFHQFWKILHYIFEYCPPTLFLISTSGIH